jgi:hypothetical protein
MSRYVAFRRQPVDQQVAQHLRSLAIPAPTRGIVQNENLAYLQPGGAIILDNWASTLRGIKLRGGTIRWCDTGEALPIISAFEYITSSANQMFAANESKLFNVTSNAAEIVKSGQTSGNYSAAQFSNAAGDWMLVCNDAGDPILRYDGTTWVTLDPNDPVVIADWINGSAYTPGEVVHDGDLGTYWRAQTAHTSAAGGTFEDDRTANPSYWDVDSASDGQPWISGAPASTVADGIGLTYVWKYRNRLFFIEGGTMDAWYLGINSVGGALQRVSLAGSATRGGFLLFGAVWSIDAGDGTDDKCVFVTNLGELLIFSGTNPSDSANWKQEGRYSTSPPLGMNAHINIGGDLMIMTVDGIVPTSQAISKTAGQLELAMLTRTIKPLWRQQVLSKRDKPWTAVRWDEYGAAFVAVPGGEPGQRFCLVVNNATGAWSRFLGFDATCFIRMRGDLFFGTQDGVIMQAERTGYDDGNHAKLPYVATLLGGWETFGVPAGHIVWHQTRATFLVGPGEPFRPQLSAAINYIPNVPPPPPAMPDNTIGADLWDVGVWGPPGSDPPTPAELDAYLQWDMGMPAPPSMQSTLWVSIGRTGYAHAPIVQITVAQQLKPNVELIVLSATYEPAGVNVD